jgi:hypothetical protein
MTRPWLGPGTTTAAIDVLWRQAGVGRLCCPVPGQAGRGGLAPVSAGKASSEGAWLLPRDRRTVHRMVRPWSGQESMEPEFCSSA